MFRVTTACHLKREIPDGTRVEVPGNRCVGGYATVVRRINPHDFEVVGEYKGERKTVSAGEVSKARSQIPSMHAVLPYGKWICADGREVLYNRGYCPIWQKLPDGTVLPAEKTEWVKDIVLEGGDKWSFNDGNPPWRNKASLHRCIAVLAEWGIAVPEFPKSARW